MNDLETPGEVLERARSNRNWSFHEAARRAGIGDQQLKNLESGKTDPSDVKVRTLMSLVSMYWPDVKLPDLVEQPLFDFAPATAEAATLLGSRSTSHLFLQELRLLARNGLT